VPPILRPISLAANAGFGLLVADCDACHSAGSNRRLNLLPAMREAPIAPRLRGEKEEPHVDQAIAKRRGYHLAS